MTMVRKNRWFSLILAGLVTLSVIGCSLVKPDCIKESGKPEEETADEVDLTETETDMTETETDMTETESDVTETESDVPETETDVPGSEKDCLDSAPIEEDQLLLSLSIYLCDDVYRSASTPTHGEASVYSPVPLTDYVMEDCKILLCADGCDPADVVNRAFSGYAPVWRIDQYEEYTTADGWHFDTRRYINEVPEYIRQQMKDQGAPEYVMFPREYLYLVTLDETHYAYFDMVPADVEGEKPADEVALVNELVKQFRIEWCASPAEGE